MNIILAYWEPLKEMFYKLVEVPKDPKDVKMTTKKQSYC